ncbi:MAG: hypothetical protein HC895_19725 [Leptolyngbyaceae cyanobacterium SM1_3_5]|nr:hypothetical protein [Leptolyngbyaceae cyanobacterium SM1_3_5]
MEHSDLSVVQVAEKLKAALDVEQVTKKFHKDFKADLEWFVLQIQSINKGERSPLVCVNHLESADVYFLQYKGFVDGNREYLQEKLAQFEDRGFYRDFLRVLFLRDLRRLHQIAQMKQRRC